MKLLTFIRYHHVKPNKTYYQILQINSNASSKDIRHHYLKLAKIYHPDVYKGSDKLRFEKIQEAYENLIDIVKRKKYDQSLGIKTNINQSITKQSSNQSFDYTTSTSINIDQEYQKFFKKKPQTQFQQIRMYQDPQFRGMNQQQRVRRQFTQIYQDNKKLYQMGFQQSFKNILNDQIQQKNQYHKQTQSILNKNAYLNTDKGIKRQKIIIYIKSVIFAIIFFPTLIISVLKYKENRKNQVVVDKIILEARTQLEQNQVKSRFIY